MSQRLPVIATPSGCAPALVRDRETGFRVALRDADAIAAAAIELRGRRRASRPGAAARTAVSG